MAYIKKILIKNIDVSRFQVKTNISNAIAEGKIIFTAISMDLKQGDFVIKNGYFIGVKNGLADVILISGNRIAPKPTQFKRFKGLMRSG